MGAAALPLAIASSVIGTGVSAFQGIQSQRRQRQQNIDQAETQRIANARAEAAAREQPRQIGRQTAPISRQRRLRSLRRGIASTIRTGSRGTTSAARLSTPALAAGTKLLLGQ